MFIGHFAPALVAAAHPKAPNLGLLFVGAQLVDFGFFAFVLAGIEHLRIVPGITAMNPLDLYHMPYTHSLAGSLVWGAAFALLIYALTRNATGAWIGGGVVVSHWLLDLLVHRPDLTLAGSPPMLGFGLWDYPAIAMPLEILVIGGAILFYLSRTRAKEERGHLPLILLVILLAAFQAIDWFGSPPEAFDPSIAVMALLSYSLAALAAWWLGRSREPRKDAQQSAATL
ncbi:hypothetical protein HFP57_15400 [Parasphingopyxis algicola]|uniref:hypothetical protein n=1 Tax=Parasphingopyxis algicola TaxID=2026624 RepID=UPI00159FB8AF|nr:hypothetical protein [Parasphingopyxis algicola]QLC26278.1 hypothetical protein HFP57_15400 [Parasphingopyxis algicola]